MERLPPAQSYVLQVSSFPRMLAQSPWFQFMALSMSSRCFLVRCLRDFFAGFGLIFYYYSLAVASNGVNSYTYIVASRPHLLYVFAQTVVLQTDNRQVESVYYCGGVDRHARRRDAHSAKHSMHRACSQLYTRQVVYTYQVQQEYISSPVDISIYIYIAAVRWSWMLDAHHNWYDDV